MKGLFTRDFLWLISQRRSLLIFGFVALIMLGAGNLAFASAFLSVLVCVLCNNRIMVDLNKTAAPFLFTLPFSRKQYVMEKYLFSLILPGSLLLIMSVIEFALKSAPSQEILVVSGASLMIVILLSCISIPASILFKDKSTFALMIVSGGAAIAATSIPEMNLSWLSNINWNLAAVIGAIVLLVVYILSIFVSMQALKKEQF